MTILASALWIAGAGLMLLAAIGVVRLPDVFGRLQAGTKGASLGVAFIFAGTALVTPGLLADMKLVLAIMFQFATAPVAAHVIGRAAYWSGAPMWEGTVVDELGRAEVVEPEHRDPNADGTAER